ncbi:hypothetical protein KJ849_04120 [bacterium]|nr:hypothetical protein [bacterium]
MKRCFEIRYCPASCYIVCDAYKNGTDCWDTPHIPCCKRDNKGRCLECFVLIQAKEEKKD